MERTIDSKLNVNFSKASSRTPLQTGTNICTMISQIDKYLTDLKSVAFSGSYTDLSDLPEDFTYYLEYIDALSPKPFTLRQSDWHNLDSPVNDYLYYADIIVEDITQNDIPNVYFDFSCKLICDAAGISSISESYDGYIRIYCDHTPLGDMTGTYNYFVKQS